MAGILEVEHFAAGRVDFHDIRARPAVPPLTGQDGQKAYRHRSGRYVHPSLRPDFAAVARRAQTDLDVLGVLVAQIHHQYSGHPRLMHAAPWAPVMAGMKVRQHELARTEDGRLLVVSGEGLSQLQQFGFQAAAVRGELHETPAELIRLPAAQGAFAQPVKAEEGHARRLACDEPDQVELLVQFLLRLCPGMPAEVGLLSL